MAVFLGLFIFVVSCNMANTLEDGEPIIEEFFLHEQNNTDVHKVSYLHISDTHISSVSVRMVEKILEQTPASSVIITGDVCIIDEMCEIIKNSKKIYYCFHVIMMSMIVSLLLLSQGSRLKS